jgi:hypothetical protein
MTVPEQGRFTLVGDPHALDVVSRVAHVLDFLDGSFYAVEDGLEEIDWVVLVPSEEWREQRGRRNVVMSAFKTAFSSVGAAAEILGTPRRVNGLPWLWVVLGEFDLCMFVYTILNELSERCREEDDMGRKREPDLVGSYDVSKLVEQDETSRGGSDVQGTTYTSSKRKRKRKRA